VRLSQTCRSTESARAQGKKGTPYGDTLVLATAVYVVVARSDTEY
jgi:hypothetical protein